MDEMSLLKRLPKGHYTLHNGKCITVQELLDIVEKKEDRKKTRKKKG